PSTRVGRRSNLEFHASSRLPAEALTRPPAGPVRAGNVGYFRADRRNPGKPERRRSGAHHEPPGRRPALPRDHPVGLTVLVNAGPWLPVPPPAYGGIENVVATLLPQLRDRGHRVVLATVGES